MESKFKELKTEEVSYDLLCREAWKALVPMEGTSAGIVRRVLYWLNRDPQSLTMEDAQCIRKEITALGSIKISDPEPWIDTVLYHLKTHKNDRGSFRAPDARGTARFLTTLNECFETLADPKKGRVEVGPLRATFFLSKRGKTQFKKEKDLIHHPSHHNLIDEAIFRVLRALHACGTLMERCPECENLFLANRTNQRYCGLACQNRATSKAYIQKKTQSKGKKPREKARQKSGFSRIAKTKKGGR